MRHGGFILKKILISIIIILIVASTFYVIYSKVKKPNEKELKISKLNEELNYISYNLIEISNLLNNIYIDEFKVESKSQEISSKNNNEESEDKSNESSGNNNVTENKSSKDSTSKIYSVQYNESIGEEPNWEEVQSKNDSLNNSWGDIIIDLNRQKISNEDIMNFSKELNELKKVIDNKEKLNSIKIVTNLYNYIPIFLKGYLEDDRKIKIEETKRDIIIAYGLLNEEKLNQVKEKIQEAENNYNYILNDISNNKNQYNINKIYILMKEFENSLEANNKKVMFLKYKNLEEELINIE